MFENHYDYSKEFYQFFKIIKLKGLSQDETIKFLTVIANDKQKERRKVILFLEMHKLFAGIFVTGWK